MRINHFYGKSAKSKLGRFGVSTLLGLIWRLAAHLSSILRIETAKMVEFAPLVLYFFLIRIRYNLNNTWTTSPQNRP